eukprot:4176175-Amphidinium_carterae.2
MLGIRRSIGAASSFPSLFALPQQKDLRTRGPLPRRALSGVGKVGDSWMGTGNSGPKTLELGYRGAESLRRRTAGTGRGCQAAQ